MILYKHNSLEQEYEMPYQELAKKFMASKFNNISGNSLDRALMAFIAADLESVIELDDPRNIEEWEELRRDILIGMYVH